MSGASIKRASAFLGPSGSMAEVTFDRERVPNLQWLVQSGVNGTSKQAVMPTLSLSDGSELAPPADKHGLAGKHVILLPQRPSLRGHEPTQDLLDGLTGFINRYCDVPPLWEQIMAHYVLMTWVYDRFSAVPYLRFLGEPQSGKTRCLMTCAYLSYKSVIGGGSTSSSAFFRLLDVWRGTFVIDEADYGKSDLWADIIKILNSGYMRGLPVLRSEKVGTGYDPCAYDVYGPKILSTRKEFDDIALESRCLTLRTQDRQISSRIPRQIPDDFYSEALELRNRCLQWRLDNWLAVSGRQDELLTLNPRLTQITVPLWSVSPSASFKIDFLDFLSSAAREVRENSHTALIVEAIRQATVNSVQWPAMVAIKDLAETATTVAQDWGADVKFTPKSAGGLVRSLGFTTFRNRSGVYEFVLTKEKLAELIARNKG